MTDSPVDNLAVATRPRPEPIDRPSAAIGARYAGLEGYRGLAALAIVIYHVFQNVDVANEGAFTNHRSAGYLAMHGLDAFVALFFVLSAFLLALPYMRAALAGDAAPSGRAFLWRRAARVVPLYFIAILVVWSARNPEIFGDWRDLVKHLAFVHVYDQERIFYTIGPAWSLAVEVQFYLALALGGWVATRVSRRLASRWRLPFLVAGTLAVFAASLGWKLYAAYVIHAPGNAWPVWFGLPAKLDEFALGVLLAIVVARGTWRLGVPALWIARASGLAILVFAFWARPAADTDHVWFHTVVAVGFMAILASSVMGPADAWVRALSSPTFALLGLVSYSLYMWHEPLLSLLTGHGLFPPTSHAAGVLRGSLVLVPLSLLVAWLSYQLIEEPVGKLRMLVDRDGRSRDYYNGE